MKKRIIVAISGASGSIYGIRLLKALLSIPVDVYLVISKAGLQVIEHETGFKPLSRKDSIVPFLKKGGLFHEDAVLEIYDHKDFFAPFASGSFLHNGMVIAPCSMKTLGAIASGIAENLIHRAAEVCLKEKRPLILMTRETPLSSIHIKNMYRASLAGATIMPPSPGFYFRPNTVTELVDSVVGRVLDHLNIEHSISLRWKTEG